MPHNFEAHLELLCLPGGVIFHRYKMSHSVPKTLSPFCTVSLHRSTFCFFSFSPAPLFFPSGIILFPPEELLILSPTSCGSLTFPLPENVVVIPSLWKAIVVGRRVPGWRGFAVGAVKTRPRRLPWGGTRLFSCGSF